MIRRLPSDAVLLLLVVGTVLAVLGSALLLHHLFLGDADVRAVVPAHVAAG